MLIKIVIYILGGLAGYCLQDMFCSSKIGDLQWSLLEKQSEIKALNEALEMKEQYIKSLEEKATEESTITVEDCEHECLFDGEIKCCMVCGAQCEGACHGECRRDG